MDDLIYTYSEEDDSYWTNFKDIRVWFFDYDLKKEKLIDKFFSWLDNLEQDITNNIQEIVADFDAKTLNVFWKDDNSNLTIDPKNDIFSNVEDFYPVTNTPLTDSVWIFADKNKRLWASPKNKVWTKNKKEIISPWKDNKPAEFRWSE